MGLLSDRYITVLPIDSITIITNVHMNIHTYTHIYTYIHTYIHIHTYT